MCIWLEVKPIRLSVIKALSDEAAVEMVEKKIFPLIFYATDKAVPLHATMIQKGNIATAFLGASFSGKSTLAAYFISKHGYSLISDDILPIYTDSGKSYTYKMTSKLRLRRNSAEHIPTKETLMDVKPHSILVRKLFVINNSQNVFCHTNKNCLEALMKNLFAPYYCNFTEYEIIPYVFYVLYFTNWIFKDTELQKYVEAFRTLEGESLLDYYGLAEKERKPWKVDFQTRLEADNLYEFIRDPIRQKEDPAAE